MDGNLRHAGWGEVPWRDADVYFYPVDLDAMTTGSNYRITSDSDPAFSDGLRSVNDFRKSKGGGF